MHFQEIFLPDLGVTPDHNTDDLESEFAANTLIQNSIRGFLRGEMPLDSFEDVLNENGVDPLFYWQVVEDNVDAVLNAEQPIHIEGAESLVLLPGRDF